ncbi:hypothetical protein [uncultured Microscilla sp.]|uniref:hypothetical protein n=1 Tax=uncultured Microscilla sp. TaxID=432653 RepID=UPI0026066B88|nr:hypothetical protein [uncultured Microscilla sp.]
MKKIYLINHQTEDGLLKSLFPVALRSEGLGFIERVPLNQHIQIKGGAMERAPKLNALKIEGLDEIHNLREVLVVHLEQDIEGISTKHRTPEVAILLLQEFESTFRLQIWLIELKTSITNRSLDSIEAKFRCAMNRMYMLLNFLDYADYGGQKNIYMTFKGLVLYNNDHTKTEDDRILYQILKHYREGTITHKRDVTLRCDTLLSENDKIQVKFIQNTTTNLHNFVLSLKELMRNPL